MKAVKLQPPQETRLAVVGSGVVWQVDVSGWTRECEERCKEGEGAFVLQLWGPVRNLLDDVTVIALQHNAIPVRYEGDAAFFVTPNENEAMEAVRQQVQRATSCYPNLGVHVGVGIGDLFYGYLGGSHRLIFGAALDNAVRALERTERGYDVERTPSHLDPIGPLPREDDSHRFTNKGLEGKLVGEYPPAAIFFADLGFGAAINSIIANPADERVQSLLDLLEDGLHLVGQEASQHGVTLDKN